MNTQPAATPAPPTGLSLETRRSILQAEIARYIRQGYRVISQTDTTAQLVKPKRFSWFWFVMNVLWIFGWLLYLIYFAAKRDQQVYIEVDANGRVRTRR
jgi:hypothetical protein